MLPISKMKYDAKLLDKDEIQIMKPMPPIGKLFYMEYVYETLLEIRNKKINKIKGNIKK